MNKEEMIEIILDYKDELRDEYNDMLSSFGFRDSSTERLQNKYTTLLLLIEKLGLNENN